MTERELKNYTRGIAYQAIKFEKGEISGEEMVRILRASFGNDVFEEANEIIEGQKNNK